MRKESFFESGEGPFFYPCMVGGLQFDDILAQLREKKIGVKPWIEDAVRRHIAKLLDVGPPPPMQRQMRHFTAGPLHSLMSGVNGKTACDEQHLAAYDLELCDPMDIFYLCLSGIQDQVFGSSNERSINIGMRPVPNWSCPDMVFTLNPGYITEYQDPYYVEKFGRFSIHGQPGIRFDKDSLWLYRTKEEHMPPHDPNV